MGGGFIVGGSLSQPEHPTLKLSCWPACYHCLPDAPESSGKLKGSALRNFGDIGVIAVLTPYGQQMAAGNSRKEGPTRVWRSGVGSVGVVRAGLALAVGSL